MLGTREHQGQGLPAVLPRLPLEHELFSQKSHAGQPVNVVIEVHHVSASRVQACANIKKERKV